MTIRNFLKEGDVLCFRYYEGIFQKLTRLANYLEFGKDGWTNGITHVAIITGFGKNPEGEACAIVSEALESGIKSSLYALWWLEARINDKTCIVRRPIQQVYVISEHIKNYEGIHYDWLSILAIGYRILFNKKIWFYDYFRGPNKQYCMEFVLRILYDASNKLIDLEPECGFSFDELLPHHMLISEQFKTIYN
jgi:hypothetical protein